LQQVLMSSAAPEHDRSIKMASGRTRSAELEGSAARAVARLGIIAVEIRDGLLSAGPAAVAFDIHEDLTAIEQVWRAFEQTADGTVFQTFEWLSTWQRYIGAREGVRPAVVVGRGLGGKTLFILPLAVSDRRYGRVLSFLGSELCDYNAPMLAPEFAQAVPEPLPLFQRVFERLRVRFGYDVVKLDKMPAAVGTQANPLLDLPTILHPSGAYLTPLGPDWESFYREKRSSSTRQRDRGKRKKLGRFGEVRIVHPVSDDDIAATLDTLMEQKGKAFARMGVSNMFARPGYREFFHALAASPVTRQFTHVSRLQVGDETAAVNLGLAFRDRYYYVLASYGEGELSRFGPGAAHLRDLMEYAIGHGYRIFDFTVGDEPYKREWCCETALYDHVAGAGARGVVVAAVLRRALSLKRTIKRNPALWRIACGVREVLGRLRRQRAF
jgi:CelD/BcsL family acetyltransferase involved in cellulose biosynthesis